ncbi:hypothetical protein D3C72_2314590 [compost metagenome]
MGRAAAHHMFHVGRHHAVVGVLRLERVDGVLSHRGVAGADEQVHLLAGNVRLVVDRAAGAVAVDAVLHVG